ncbi:alpha/beta hydrolase [bacterium]|nr:MAG: alpha/beta hydrolase [bacterium]
MSFSPVETLVILALSAALVLAQEAKPRYDQPLGIGFESYAYPQPVSFLPLEIEGQKVRMAYMDVKPTTANGKTVVLLHGKNFFGAYWKSTITALTGRGYRVVVPDQIGFGKSSKPDIEYSFDLLAANTLKLLDELKIEKAAVVGHSMGGMLAVRFARNYPTRTSGLILENPIGLEDYRFSIPPRTDEEVYTGEMAQTEAKVRDYFTTYLAKPNPALLESYVEAQSRVMLSAEWPRYAKASASTYQMIYRQPVRHEFGLIKVPTLLVIGQADRTAVGKAFAPAELRPKLGNYPVLGREAARDIPGAKLVEIENVGHIPHLESADRFQDALINFVSER